MDSNSIQDVEGEAKEEVVISETAADQTMMDIDSSPGVKEKNLGVTADQSIDNIRSLNVEGAEANASDGAADPSLMGVDSSQYVKETEKTSAPTADQSTMASQSFPVKQEDSDGFLSLADRIKLRRSRKTAPAQKEALDLSESNILASSPAMKIKKSSNLKLISTLSTTNKSADNSDMAESYSSNQQPSVSENMLRSVLCSSPSKKLASTENLAAIEQLQWAELAPSAPESPGSSPGPALATMLRTPIPYETSDGEIDQDQIDMLTPPPPKFGPKKKRASHRGSSKSKAKANANAKDAFSSTVDANINVIKDTSPTGSFDPNLPRHERRPGSPSNQKTHPNKTYIPGTSYLVSRYEMMHLRPAPVDRAATKEKFDKHWRLHPNRRPYELSGREWYEWQGLIQEQKESGNGEWKEWVNPVEVDGDEGEVTLEDLYAADG